MITMIYKEDDQDGLGGEYAFYLDDGTKIPRSFTPETGKEASERFLKLLNDNKHTIIPLVKQYLSAQEWNSNHKGIGKNWPIFSQLERTLNNLQKMAGIVDT